MIEVSTAKAISAAILSPLIQIALSGAKQIGVKGFQKWEQASHHSKIQKKIASIENLKTFWSADKLVSLTDFYYPSKILIDDMSRTCQLLTELPRGNLIIEGIVGQGKSIYLRHLATSEIRSNQAKTFPIFIEFRTLSKNNTLDLAIKKYLDEIHINGYDDDTFDYVMSSGNFVLLLDAFDEIEETVTKEVFTLVEHFAEKYEKLKIIITSRPSAQIQKSAKFEVIKLAPLREVDYTPFLQKLGLPASLIAELKVSIKNSPSKVSELITTPLMLTLVVRAYRSVKEIPENLPDFFEVLFKCVFSGHDNAKPYIKRTHSTDLSEKKLQELFETFCFVCLRNKTARSLSTVVFDQYFSKALQIQGNIDCDAEDFRNDMHRVACLILPDGYETWVFLHKSILEYYAASFIRRSNEDFVKRFYEHARKETLAWIEVLTFLQYIDEYRFNKYFLVEEIDQVLRELKFVENCVNCEEVLDYYENLGQKFSMGMDFDNESGVTFVSMDAGRIKFCTRNTAHKPFFAYVQSITEDGMRVADEDFRDFLKKGANSDGSVRLDARQVVKLFGERNLILELKTYFSRLKSKREEVAKLLAINDSRCDILDL